MVLAHCAWVAVLSVLASAQNSFIASLPYEYTYYLPDGFEGVIPQATNIGNVTSTFVNSTTTNNETIAEALAVAAAAPFISYSDEFLELLGPDPSFQLIEDRPGELFAFEGAIWIPNRRQVWFTSAFYQPPGYILILHLDNGTITQPDIAPEWFNFQRGVYSASDDLVYMTSYRDNSTYKGGLVTIHPDTYEVTPIFNSYFGLTFNALCDVTWGLGGDNGSDRYLYLTDIPLFLSFAYDPLPPNQLWTNAYRWDFQNELLLPVMGGTQLPGLTGLKLGPDLRTLYAADSGDPNAQVASSQSIYKFDLDDNMIPVNQRLFAVPRFFLDGFHVDDAGRVWSAEGDGIVVRNSGGRTIGVFNKLFFGRQTSFGNLVLAGDVLVLLAVDRVWTVQLAQEVVTPESRHVFG